MLESLHLSFGKILKFFEFTCKHGFVLLNFRGTALDATTLANRIEHLDALAQFLVFLNLGVVRIVFAEEGAGGDKVRVRPIVHALRVR